MHSPTQLPAVADNVPALIGAASGKSTNLRGRPSGIAVVWSAERTQLLSASCSPLGAGLNRSHAGLGFRERASFGTS